MGDPRYRILFCAEAVTLAHIARPMCLARSLDPKIFNIAIACDSRYNKLFGDSRITHFPVYTIPSEQFLAHLAKGLPLYDQQTLRHYVRDDLEIINSFKPHIIIGDFRLSLSVSARIASIPYVAISNAYWSPYTIQHYPVPDLPLTHIAGIRIAQLIFTLARPFAFARHTIPLNKVRKEYGLPSLGSDLRVSYTDADYVLYCDLPGLIKMRDLPSHHQFLGPIIWSPEVSLPAWWDQIPDDRPLVYVTLGSSGCSKHLPAIIDALAKLPATVAVATAGRINIDTSPDNTYISEYLPGTESAQRANLVICNGGSPTSQQALAVGTPVIGIASNLDQHLNMAAVEAAGAGIKLRSEHAASHICDATLAMLNNPRYGESAQELASQFASCSAIDRFRKFILERFGI